MQCGVVLETDKWLIPCWFLLDSAILKFYLKIILFSAKYFVRVCHSNLGAVQKFRLTLPQFGNNPFPPQQDDTFQQKKLS